MTRRQQYRALAGGIALLAGLAVGGCGSDTSIQQTNAQQTEQLNAIAANTTETAGNMQSGEASGTPAAQAASVRTPTRPRKY